MPKPLVELDLKTIDIDQTKSSSLAISERFRPKFPIMPSNDHLRFFLAITAVFAIFTFIGCLVKIDMQPTKLKNFPEASPIKLICDDLGFQHRATDAFFIPTEYGTRYHPPKPRFDENDKYQGKPIFSELDKIRIFNIFLKHFSESEYWVVARLNLRPQNDKNREPKHFIESVEREIERDYVVSKLPNWGPEVPFKDE
ncbi:MAG: hypothetical protein LBF42_04205 [Puniceicoccales bacterium]|nr:hypothetical protein [Puniceicoccales bacterium]